MSKIENIPKTLGEMQGRLEDVVSGLQSPVCTLTNLTVNMVSYSKADLTKLILGWIAIFAAVNQALTAYHDAVKTRNSVEPIVRAFLENLLGALEQAVGTSETALALYGFKPKKPRTPLTVDEKASQLQKIRATRQKNGTMGADQKKALDKGVAPEPGNAGTSGTSGSSVTSSKP